MIASTCQKRAPKKKLHRTAKKVLFSEGGHRKKRQSVPQPLEIVVFLRNPIRIPPVRLRGKRFRNSERVPAEITEGPLRVEVSYPKKERPGEYQA